MRKARSLKKLFLLNTMSNIDTVLFDLDGTLIDTNKLIIESFHYALDQMYQESADIEAITSSFGKPLNEAFRPMAKSEQDIDELIRLFRVYNFARHDDYVEIFPGVEEVIVRLKEKKFKTGIVTSKLNKMAKRGLNLFGLEKYIDVCIGADDTSIHKPDPFPVLECLRRLDSKGQNSFMVGDSPYDITAGKLSGCKTVFVNYSMVSIDREKLEADYLIDHMIDLAEILKI